MSNQYSIFDDCFIDSFAGAVEALVRANLPEYCKKKISDMAQLHSVMSS